MTLNPQYDSNALLAFVQTSMAVCVALMRNVWSVKKSKTDSLKACEIMWKGSLLWSIETLYTGCHGYVQSTVEVVFVCR